MFFFGCSTIKCVVDCYSLVAGPTYSELQMSDRRKSNQQIIINYCANQGAYHYSGHMPSQHMRLKLRQTEAGVGPFSVCMRSWMLGCGQS